MEPFKLSLNELITVGCVIASVTTIYVLLSSDVKAIKEDMIDLKLNVDTIQREQFRINYTLGIREGWAMSEEEKAQLRKELERKPWRMTK